MASNRPGFYISKFGYPSPISSQNMGSNPPSNGPKSPKNPFSRLNMSQKSQEIINIWFKNHFPFNYWAYPP
jgi:hypothetical protein